MAGAGGTQIINGKSYDMYTPDWYGAKDAAQVHAGDVAGQTAGTAAGAASKAQWQTKYPGIQTPGPYDYQNVMTGLSSAINNGFGGNLSGNGNFNSAPPANVGAYSGSGSGTSAPTAHIAAPDTSAAENAAFARAKDQVGLSTRGAISGLAGAMAGRGIVGSGVEGRGQLGAVNAGQQQLADVSRQQAITHADLAQKNAESEYSGAITQRGQDLSNNVALNGLNLTARGQDVTQRGQDISFQDSQNQLALERQKLAMQQLQSLSQQFSTFRPAY